MHGLITANLSLRQELERAYKTMEASQTKNTELEGLLEEIATTENTMDTDLGDSGTIEQLQARYIQLEKEPVATEERFKEALFGTTNHASTTEGKS